MERVCVKCGDDYTLPEKLAECRRLGKSPGRVSECADCADDSTVVLTGVMVYGHKTAGTIQINRDPSLTDYMRRAGGWVGRRSLGCTHKVSSLDTKNRVYLEVREVAKRRE